MQQTKRKRETHLIGGVWEFSKWEVEFDSINHLYAPEVPCPHAKVSTEEQHRSLHRDSPLCETPSFCTPSVVVATNEGGYNTTGVCLDCILDIYGAKRT